MSDQQGTIAPPPSLGDILGHQERIGRVDFTQPLAPAPTEPEQREPEQREPEQREPEQREQPAATVAPEVTHDPTPDPAQEPAPDLGPDPGPAPLAEEPHHDDHDHHPHHDQHEPEDSMRPPYAEEETRTAPTAGWSTDLASDPGIDPVTEWGSEWAGESGRRTETQVAALLSLVPAEDLATVGESFDDVVEAVLRRIRAAEVATVRHLAAVEEEAARRCEMVTAQAELDAELIRLHARREAHAIIAASRVRTGESIRPTPDEARLHQLGDATERLAQELGSFGDDPETPDHPWLR